MRVWLHQSSGNETGWNAWCLDLLGFATWGPSEGDVLRRVPGKLDEHLKWLLRHEVQHGDSSGGTEVVERVRGDEVLFGPDREPCSTAEIDLAIELLSASRSDLLATVSSLPQAALDWDPPYRAFADWASWRTIRQILVHIANTETHYYLRSIGYEPRRRPATPKGGWEEPLRQHRDETVLFLRKLRHDPDRARVSLGEEQWSVRKVVRRLVRHELLHWKSIRRIGQEYGRRHT
jgi:hypothetical protein